MRIVGLIEKRTKLKDSNYDGIVNDFIIDLNGLRNERKKIQDKYNGKKENKKKISKYYKAYYEMKRRIDAGWKTRYKKRRKKK